MTTFGTVLFRCVRAPATVAAGFVAVCGIAAAPPSPAAAAERQNIVREGETVVMTPPKGALPVGNDYENAKGEAAADRRDGGHLAAAEAITPADPQKLFGTAGSAAGFIGNGIKAPVRVARGALAAEFSADETAQPEEFGTYNRPFTTNRVDPQGNVITNSYPFVPPAGCSFEDHGITFVCSASLIKPGIVVTAAHCVAEFGARSFFGNFEFIPAYRNGLAPYGVWKAAKVRVRRSYMDGSAGCDPAALGVICRNDIAIIRLEAQSGAYPGTSTGWFGYGWNGYGFTPTGITHITQLGYPVALDGGFLMQRNNSQGVVSAERVGNTLIGSLMTGGSSGGPWLVNLGIPPVLSGTGFGFDEKRNIVVGVTSWGYVSTLPKEQGASPFTSGNIVPMVDAECATTPAACS